MLLLRTESAQRYLSITILNERIAKNYLLCSPIYELLVEKNQFCRTHRFNVKHFLDSNNRVGMSLGFQEYNEAHQETDTYEYFSKMHQGPLPVKQDSPENYDPDQDPEGTTDSRAIVLADNRIDPPPYPYTVKRPNSEYSNPQRIRRNIPARMEGMGRLPSGQTFSNLYTKLTNQKSADPYLNALQGIKSSQLDLIEAMGKRQEITMHYLQKLQEHNNSMLLNALSKNTEKMQYQFGQFLAQLLKEQQEKAAQHANWHRHLRDHYPKEEDCGPTTQITTRSDIKRTLQNDSDYIAAKSHRVQYPNQEAQLIHDLNCDPELDELFSHPKRPIAPREEFMKFSDENPLHRQFKGVNTLLRKERLWVGDLLKNNPADLPESFTVDLNEGYRNIRYIFPTIVDIRWTPTATYTRNCFLRFPDFDNFETTSTGFRYHLYIPLEQGPAATPLSFTERF